MYNSLELVNKLSHIAWNFTIELNWVELRCFFFDCAAMFGLKIGKWTIPNNLYKPKIGGSSGNTTCLFFFGCMWLNVCFGEKKEEEEALVESKWGHVEIKLFFLWHAFDKVIDWSVTTLSLVPSLTCNPCFNPNLESESSFWLTMFTRIAGSYFWQDFDFMKNMR